MSTTHGESSRKVLEYGRFFGSTAHSADVCGFALADMSADPAWEAEWHSHSTAHFILVSAGDYVTTAYGALEPHRPALVYNPPGTEHRDHFRKVDRKAIGQFMSIAVAEDRMREIAAQFTLPAEPVVVTDPMLVALAGRLRREVTGWTPASHLAAEGLCLELSGQLTNAASRENASAKAPSWLHTARELIHDSLGEPITMGEIATAAGVHPVHLARAFRRHFGCAPAAYLKQCRLSRAASLLASTTEPLVSIAIGNGFGDQSHFTNAFRHAYDTTPGEYRRIAHS